MLRTEAAQIDIGMSAAIGDMLADFEKFANERTQAARAHFAKFCKEQRIAVEARDRGTITAEFREVMGDEADHLIAESRFHDLTVVAGGPERASRLSQESLGAVVTSSGRPVLLVPAKARQNAFKTIAVAWKAAPEAARAITAAMPLLEKAEHVHVLGANEENAQAMACLDCSDAMTGYLRRHGIKANCHFVIPAGRSVPDSVVETAQSMGADLLVMGAYSHSRAREFVFGGFTRHVLHGVNLPVLMVH